MELKDRLSNLWDEIVLFCGKYPEHLTILGLCVLFIISFS